MKKGIFISLAVVVVIFLAMLGIYIDKRIPITKGFFYLCENVNNSIECRDTDVNFSSLKIKDKKRVFIYDKNLFNSEIRFNNYISNDIEITTIKDLIDLANENNETENLNVLQIKKYDKKKSFEIMNDFDLNFTKLTNDIAGGFEFVNEDDSNEFIKLYNKSILN